MSTSFLSEFPKNYISRILDLFTGYKEELKTFDEVFDEFLALGKKKIVAIMGPPGVGKTWFVHFVTETRIKPMGILYVYVNLKNCSSWVTALHKIQRKISEKYGFNTPNFIGLWNEIRRRVLENALDCPLSKEPMFPELYLLASFPKSYYVLRKNVGSFQIDLREELKEPEIFKLVYLLPLAIAQDINEELKERETTLVLIIDSIENLDDPTPLSWLLYALNNSLIIVTSTDNNKLDKLCEPLKGSSVRKISLEGFTKNELVEYIRKRGVETLEGLEEIFKSDRVNPLLIANILDLWELLDLKNVGINSHEEIRKLLRDKLSDEPSNILLIIDLLRVFDINVLVNVAELNNKEELLPKILLSSFIEIHDPFYSQVMFRKELWNIFSEEKISTIIEKVVAKVENLHQKTNDIKHLAHLISLVSRMNEEEGANLLFKNFESMILDGNLIDALELLEDVSYLGIFSSQNSMAGLRLLKAQLLDEMLDLNIANIDDIINSPYVRPLYLLRALNILATKSLREKKIDTGQKFLRRVIEYASIKDPKIIRESLKACRLMMRYNDEKWLEALEIANTLYAQGMELAENDEDKEKIIREHMLLLLNAVQRFLIDGKRDKARELLKEIKEHYLALKKVVLIDAMCYLSTQALLVNIINNNDEIIGLSNNALAYSLGDERDLDTTIMFRKALIAAHVGERLYSNNMFDDSIKYLDRAGVLYREIINRSGWYYLGVLNSLGKVFRLLGACYIKLGRIKDSISALTTSMEFYRLYLDYSKFRAVDKLDDIIDSLELLSEAYYILGKEKSVYSLLDDSYKLLQKIRNSIGDDPRVLRGYARVFLRDAYLRTLKNDYDGALDKLEKALKLVEELRGEGELFLKARIHSLMGEVFLRIGDYDNLQSKLREAVDLSEKSADRETFLKSSVLLGEAHIRLDQLDEARYWYSKALEAQSNSNGTFFWKKCAEIGIANVLLEEKRSEEAIQIIERVLEELKKSEEYFRDYFVGRGYVIHGKSLGNLKEFEKAREVFWRGISFLRTRVEESTDPLLLTVYAQLFYNLGKIHLKQRELDVAYGNFRTALDYALKAFYFGKSRDSYVLGLITMTRTNIARSLYKLGRKEEAAKIIREAVQSGEELVSIMPIRKYKIYYSRALQEACIMNMLVDKELTKEYYKRYRVVMRELLDEVEWQDLQLVNFYVNIAEEMKKHLLNELATELLEDFQIIATKLKELMLRDTDTEFSPLLKTFSRTIILKSDTLWKKARFSDAYANVEEALMILKSLEEKYSEDPEKLLAISLARFDLLTMKAIMRYFGEGDVDTMRSCIEECYNIIESVKSRIDERTHTRMLCDATILEARLYAFLHNYEATKEKINEVLERIKILAKIGDRARIQKYKKILRKIIRYVLSDRKIEPSLKGEYRDLLNRVNTLP